ncbi:MAG: hypothetical protein KQI81_17225 [Deltaproteobacteria bacterium]|nr:hypothetical protein [Deltaproteobacteria bacterium]
MFLSSIDAPILVCQLHRNLEIAKTGDVTITPDLLTSLSEATSRHFSLIIIGLTTKRISLRNDIIELCRCLNTHPLTKNTSVLVLVELSHRNMAVRLADAGVRFVKVVHPGEPIDPEYLLRLVHLDDPSVNINRILARLCPFIHYRPIDDQCELTTCKAYRNRMVLGGSRLHDVCETDTHVHCKYFIKPRVDS